MLYFGEFKLYDHQKSDFRCAGCKQKMDTPHKKDCEFITDSGIVDDTPLTFELVPVA